MQSHSRGATVRRTDAAKPLVPNKHYFTEIEKYHPTSAVKCTVVPQVTYVAGQLLVTGPGVEDCTIGAQLVFSYTPTID